MRARPIIILLVIIGVALLLKFFFFPTPDPEADKAKGGAPGKGQESVIVDGYIVHNDTTQRSLTLNGNLLAIEEAVLHSEVAGKVIGIYFKEGETVEKGKLLLKVQDAELQANLQKARLDVSLTEQRLKRQEKLLAVSGVSKEEYETTEAQRDAAKAQIEAIQAQIARTEVRAPFTGMIGLRAVSQGSYITPAAAIASIQQIDSLKLDFSVPSRFAGMITKGLVFSFRTETGSEDLKAIVRAIEPKIDERTRTIQVRAIAMNRSKELVPGSFVTINLPLAGKTAGFRVPAEAIVPAAKGKKIYIAEHGKAKEIMVQTGEREEKEVIILDGLKEGDTLITSGLLSVRPGVVLKYRRVR
jgi:membrane fusion protein, multidrug efflux system